MAAEISPSLTPFSGQQSALAEVLPLFYKVLYIVPKFLQGMTFAHVLRSNNGVLTII
jgi:hypothetical protein